MVVINSLPSEITPLKDHFKARYISAVGPKAVQDTHISPSLPVHAQAALMGV